MALAALIAVPFVARGGLPGLRQDWIWPQHDAGLIHWFLAGQSGWLPDGFGGALGSPTINFVLAFFAALALIGLPTKMVLAVFLVGCYALAQMGMCRFLESAGVPLPRDAAWLLGAAYAYGPVMFQKTVAGHLYFVCAYALLPWFAAFVWRACSDEPGRLRSALAAGLLAAAASAQIQFLFFDALVALIIALLRPGRARNFLFVYAVLSVAVVHNAVLVVNAPGIEQSGLLLQHATVQWERDMSGSLLQLAALGGYEHYASAALSARWQGLFTLGRVFVLLLAIFGLAAAVWKRKHARVALAAALASIAALLVALGWNGPLEPVFSYAVVHSAMFTIFRELYHVMALYALGLIVLVACAVSLLPRPAQLACALLATSVGLPFFTMGLQKMVPAVPAAAFDQACPSPNLFALLPDQEPVASVADPAHGGLDPARLLPRNGAAAGQPVAVKWALDAAAHGNSAALRAMGIGCVKWRSKVISRLPAAFEPHTGAHFERFMGRQRVFERMTTAPFRVRNARTVLSLESPHYRSALDDGLADAQLPPGKPVPVTYSFANNDIRSNWVWGRLWSWASPDLMRVSAEPILTRAHEISYDAALPSGAWTYLYVLAAAKSVRDRGVIASTVPGPARGPYRWYRWKLGKSRRISLRFVDARALARIVASTDPSWAPAASRTNGGRREAISFEAVSMWRIDGRLPSFARDRSVVFARLFAPGWRLLVGGRDLGPPRRVHGLFNGWTVSPADSGKSLTVTYAPQRFYWWLNGVATLIQLLAFAFVFTQRYVPSSSVRRAHRFARKHV